MEKKCNCIHTKKKGVSGVCRMDECCGISLVPLAYKALCGIIQVRLTEVVRERNLVVEEQGGFRRGRGCRDQLLTLMLLGQIKAMSRRGMFAGFIDFRKVYDRVDRVKLWGCLDSMGLGGRVSAFLRAVHTDTSSEVKVGEERSKPFRVECGLRQGCILSPLLFSLNVNSLVSKLKEAEVGVRCGGQLVSALLYADDAVIFAENEELMRRGLDVLAEWCTEWSVKVNVEKCGVMHMRKKGVKRSDGGFLVGGEVIKVVEEYKYLGCVVDEHMSNVRMIEERAKAGAKALSDWLRRCRATVGEVRGATFVRRLEMLVESVLLYGVEAWGCGGQLDPVENVQMRAVRIFLGVGRRHPLVYLQFEMDMLPVRWEALRRGIEFWVQVMRMDDDRLVKVVMLEALESGSKVRWSGMKVGALDGLSMKEVKQLLKNIAWRRVRAEWREKAKGQSKLEMIGKLMDNECKAWCVGVDCKRRRRMLTKLRGGTAELRIEIGRWHGLRREDRVCKECGNGEVEDINHFVMRCAYVVKERERLESLMSCRVEGWYELGKMKRF